MKTAREIIAPIIEPVGFAMTPSAYGLETQEQFERTLAWGSQQVAYEKADAILAALVAEGYQIVPPDAPLSLLNLPRRQRLALDALLVRKGQFISKDTLITAIWADDIDGGPLDADNVCETLIHHVRKAIVGTGWQIISRRFSGYSLRALGATHG